MTECNMCGDCCENIYIDERVHDIYWWATGNPNLEDYPDRNIVDATFVHDNWYPNFDGSYSCTQFNSETRLCVAHENRPPVCQDFPWYNKEPRPEVLEKYQQCSFWADIEK